MNRYHQGEPVILRTGHRFDGALATVRGAFYDQGMQAERYRVALRDGREITAFAFDMCRPRGVFPRDDLVFRAEYDSDACPRDTYERAAFLQFLGAGLHPMGFTAWVHVWRRQIVHRSFDD